MTIDDLAIMVAKGFNGIESRMATKDDVKILEERLDKIDFRLSKIEVNHERRLDKVEDKIQIIYTAFEKQLKIKLAK
jgi:tetrahydromethanopterin S-methyltransferase subunit G